MLRRRVERSPQGILHAPLGFLIAVLVVVFLIAHARKDSMANWRRELRDLSRRFPTGAEAESLLRAVMETESDRGIALIAGSMVEESLEGIITAHLIRHLGRTRRSELFGADGVISSFSAKIKVSFAFGLIDDTLRDRFDKIREIRNAFAHSKSPIDFSTPEVRRACRELTSDKFVLEMKPKYIYTFTSFMLFWAGLMVLKRAARLGNKTHSPISYDKASTFFGRSTRLYLRRTQPNLLWENNTPILGDLLQSYRE